jgi:ribosomal protein S18 acetylase RimI-like enzyme
MAMITIRPMTKNDIDSVAKIHSEVFTRQFASEQWVSCNLNAYPRILMYVAKTEKGKVVGYIQWLQKSGFRKDTVIELEQIAVLPIMQGNKIGTELIQRSLELVHEYLTSKDSILKTIMVTTRSDNNAQNLYEKILGVKVAATIKDLYSSDEVIMVAKYK